MAQSPQTIGTTTNRAAESAAKGIEDWDTLPEVSSSNIDPKNQQNVKRL